MTLHNRQRVEHVIGEVKDRPLFRQPFRGSLRHAVAFVNIIAHMVNARIRADGTVVIVTFIA